MSEQGSFLATTITVTNILQSSPHELSHYLQQTVLSAPLPEINANKSATNEMLVPLLRSYANYKGYVTTLYNLVTAELFEQKKHKRLKDNDKRNEALYTNLEAMQEILYRTMQALDRYYESASRIMTGVGSPDPRDFRH